MSGVFRSENVHCLVSTIGIFSSPPIKKLPLSKVFVIMSKPNFYNQTTFFFYIKALLARSIHPCPSCRKSRVAGMLLLMRW